MIIIKFTPFWFFIFPPAFSLFWSFIELHPVGRGHVWSRVSFAVTLFPTPTRNQIVDGSSCTHPLRLDRSLPAGKEFWEIAKGNWRESDLGSALTRTIRTVETARCVVGVALLGCVSWPLCSQLQNPGVEITGYHLGQQFWLAGLEQTVRNWSECSFGIAMEIFAPTNTFLKFGQFFIPIKSGIFPNFVWTAEGKHKARRGKSQLWVIIYRGRGLTKFAPFLR